MIHGGSIIHPNLGDMAAGIAMDHVAGARRVGPLLRRGTVVHRGGAGGLGGTSAGLVPEGAAGIGGSAAIGGIAEGAPARRVSLLRVIFLSRTTLLNRWRGLLLVLNLRRSRLLVLNLRRSRLLVLSLMLLSFLVLLLHRRRGMLLLVGRSLFVGFVLLLLGSAALMWRSALSLDFLGWPFLFVVFLRYGYRGRQRQAKDRTAGNALKHRHSDHSSATGNCDH
jgi:hypothetical protein